MKLTNNEQWILDYLKGKDYVSPTKIGYAHTHASGITGEHHSAWASFTVVSAIFLILAFASLIDKVSGKGTWDSNPWVIVYEFELLK